MKDFHIYLRDQRDVDQVQELASCEHRSVSNMLVVLVREALAARAAKIKHEGTVT